MAKAMAAQKRTRRREPSAFQARQKLLWEVQANPHGPLPAYSVTDGRLLSRFRGILSQYENSTHRGVQVEFFPYSNLKHTVRLRGDKYILRLSDIMRDAPQDALDSVAHILFSKIKGRTCPVTEEEIYGRYAKSDTILHRTRKAQRERSRRPAHVSMGKHRNLEKSFHRVNRKSFSRGRIPMPLLTWSRTRGSSRLGCYDETFNLITMNRRLDSRRVPLFVLDFIMFHEILHIVHPIKIKGGRRIIHSAEFKKSESVYDRYEEASTWLMHF